MARKRRSRRRKKRGVSTLDLTTIEGLEQIARVTGLGEEAEKITGKPKLSMWQRLGRGLLAFETGNSFYHARYDKASGMDPIEVFVGQYAEDIKQGITEAVTGRVTTRRRKKTFEDVLKREGFKDRPGKLDAVDILGLAGDILFDPTTYLHFGLGKIAKLPKVAPKLAKTKAIIGKGIHKVPGVSATERQIRRMFQPAAKMKEMGKFVHPKTGKVIKDPGELAHTYMLEHVRGLRSANNEFMGGVKSRISGERAGILGGFKVKKLGLKQKRPNFDFEASGKSIMDIMETPMKGIKTTGNPLMDDMMYYMIGGQAKYAKELGKRKLLKTQIPDFAHHAWTPEMADFYAAGGDVANWMGSKMGKYSTKHPSTFRRKYRDMASAINKEWRKTHDFDMFDENAFRAFTTYGLHSLKAIHNFDFLQRMNSTFGLKVAKTVTKYRDEFGMNWIKVAGINHPLLKRRLFPEPIAEHMNQINSILFGDAGMDSFLKGYDKIMHYFKGSVTGIFPAFHTRNALGGIFNNWIMGLTNPLSM